MMYADHFQHKPALEFFLDHATNAINQCAKYFSSAKGEQGIAYPAEPDDIGKQLRFAVESLNALYKTNFIKKVHGNGVSDHKKIAQNAPSALPTIILTGNSFFLIKSCIKGQILEVNIVLI